MNRSNLSSRATKHLLSALDDSSALVRLAALSALVRMPLGGEAWLAISRHVIQLLESIPQGESIPNQTLILTVFHTTR